MLCLLASRHIANQEGKSLHEGASVAVGPDRESYCCRGEVALKKHQSHRHPHPFWLRGRDSYLLLSKGISRPSGSRTSLSCRLRMIHVRVGIGQARFATQSSAGRNVLLAVQEDESRDGCSLGDLSSGAETQHPSPRWELTAARGVFEWESKLWKGRLCRCHRESWQQ